jgi:lycopene cyclase domain-containing protein
LTYAQFLATFLGVPIIFLLWMSQGIHRRLVVTLAGISLVAMLYTAPWDNLIVMLGVWSYGPHRILGVVLGHVPLEEYIFYVLQVILTGLVTVRLLQHRA